MPQRDLIGIVYNPRAAEGKGLAERLADKLGRARTWVCSALEVERHAERMQQSSLVVTFGGDGTILRTMHVAAPADVPLLGVNLGRVGFMTELRADEALERIDYYLQGKAVVEERTMLQAQVIPQGTATSEGSHPSFQGLNDVVVGRGAISRLIFVDTRINGVPLTTYAADALIVATATGSTGYALAAGGPILHPSDAAFILQPVAAHLGLSTALVLPSTSVVELAVRSDSEVMLSVDGVVDLPLAPGNLVRIQQSSQVARFLRADPSRYFYATLLPRLGLSPKGSPPRHPEGG
ncbi:MAG: NAD(+)/NADH kinase [Chloroflexi bacterium]|nr:NAD(+)/NADH kinase [Chloroflexota bacterium]